MKFTFKKVEVIPDTDTTYGRSEWRVFVLSPFTNKSLEIGTVIKEEGCWGFIDHLGDKRMSGFVTYSNRQLSAESLLSHYKRFFQDLGWASE